MSPDLDYAPLRIGVLGAARIAPLAMIEPARARDDVEVACVAARDRGRAETFAARHGIAQVAEDYAALVRREDIDLVYVALPPAAHAEWSIRALEAGKAVLCEKPFATDTAEATAMVAAADAAGRPLIEAFHYRRHPLMLDLIDLVRSGRLGRIRRAEAWFDEPIAYAPGEYRWTPGPGSGALMDIGCYAIHALRHLLHGEPEVRDAESVFERGVETRTAARLAFADGVEAVARCDMTANARDIGLVIEGERGRVRVGNFVLPHLGCDVTLEVDGQSTTAAAVGPTSFEAQLAHVVEVLRGRAEATTAGRDCIGNMAAIDAVVRKAAQPAEAWRP